MNTTTSEIANQLQTLEETQRTIINKLEDSEDEKNFLGNTQKAFLNILEDYSEEKRIAEDTQKAVINILEDYSIEKIAIEKMNIKLTSSNKEIEQFAYIASHDLQEPLRTISNYANLFQKQYHGKLDANADRYLDIINKATSRMQTLISDLLEYSKIGRDNDNSIIDCNLLVRDLLNDMAVGILESKSSVTVEELPTVIGYPSGLKSLFQNLISNAIKFRKSDVNPVVSITARIKGHNWLFEIKDNGIGIDKVYYDKLFIIFQRLHVKTEYPGTGIGLAQCNKIVDLHGGKIWVESKLGKGSTFYFTIPKKL